MRASQQPIAEPHIARSAGERDRADRQDRRDRGIGVELALLRTRDLADRGMQEIGVGQPRDQRRAGDVGGQSGENAGRRAADEFGLVEIGLQDRGRLCAAQPRAQAGPGDDGLGEEIVLGLEMGIEGAARQAGGQHDVVDVSAGIAAQPEQPAGVIENFGSGTGGSGGVLGHDMSTNISYDNKHMNRSSNRIDARNLGPP